MYNIIIIDDDEFSLNNLANSINWNDFDLNLCKLFTSAREAIEFIDENQVDGVFSDIKMPGMSGLTFAKYICDYHPDISVILISAYEDFRYAKEAIRVGVKDYFVKPFDFDTLEQACISMKNSIEAERKKAFFTNTNENLAFQSCISNLINKKNYSLNEFLKSVSYALKLENTNNLNCFTFTITLVNLDEYLHTEWKHGLHGIYNAVINMILFDDFTFASLSYAFDTIKVLTVYDASVGAQTEFQRFSDNLTQKCKQNLKLSVTITSNFDITTFDNFAKKTIKNEYIDILQCICIGDVYTSLNKLSGLIAKNYNNPDFLFSFSGVLFEVVKDVDCSKLKENSLGISFENEENLKYVQFNNLAQLYLVIYNISLAYLEKYGENCNNILDKAMFYINENFNREIKLIDVVKYTNSSITNFSRIFKKQTQESFVQYLKKLRISHACVLLLSTDLSINEISHYCGFETFNHFCKQFKQVMGYTAFEYKKNTLGGVLIES